jgi:hypothetical protein
MKFTNESMSIEYCPFCRTAANMIATITLKAIGRKDDTMKTITTKTYHCGSCGSFVRSIDEEEDVKSAEPQDLKKNNAYAFSL